MPFLDILRCTDDTFYVGHTDDLESRTALHNAGFVASDNCLAVPRLHFWRGLF